METACGGLSDVGEPSKTKEGEAGLKPFFSQGDSLQGLSVVGAGYVLLWSLSLFLFPFGVEGASLQGPVGGG